MGMFEVAIPAFKGRVEICNYVIPDAEPRYRLITNWMDPTEAPALELAALYHQRWTIESSLDELKTHLADRQVLLRSKRPELVEQEFYALLLVHAAVRHLMTEAAAQTGQAAEDLSFTHAIRVLHRRVVTSRGKRNPRGVRKKMSSYPVRDRGAPLHQPCDPVPVILSN